MKPNRSVTLGVLDQSPIRSGERAADGLKETVKLARATEKLGYARYWVAEHHNSHSFAGTSPAGITHIKLPGSKQGTILDESHRSITHGCRQPSNQAHRTILSAW